MSILEEAVGGCAGSAAAAAADRHGGRKKQIAEIQKGGATNAKADLHTPKEWWRSATHVKITVSACSGFFSAQRTKFVQTLAVDCTDCAHEHQQHK